MSLTSSFSDDVVTIAHFLLFVIYVVFPFRLLKHLREMRKEQAVRASALEQFVRGIFNKLH